MAFPERRAPQPVVAPDVARARYDPLEKAEVGRWLWLVVALAGAVSTLIYALVQRLAPDLAWSEPSQAEEVFPWVRNSTRVAFEASRNLPLEQGLWLHTLASARFLVLLLGLFALFGLALWVSAGQRSRLLTAAVFASGALFLGVQLFAPAMLSTDVYAYVVYGRVFGIYQGDPYSETPGLDPNDPYLPLWRTEFLPSWYGPLWTLLSAALALLVAERAGLAVLAFRLLAALAALASAALIYRILRRLDPERANQGAVFFLWNPLVVLESGMSGHNDTVMMALLLLGLWLHLRGQRALALVALCLSPLVKFVTAALVPLYLLLVARQSPDWGTRLRELARGLVAAALAVVLVVGLARWSGFLAPVLHASTDPGFYLNNVHELVFKGLRLALGEDPGLVEVSPYFQGWWVAASVTTELRAAPDPSAPLLERLAPGTVMLVLAPQETEWLWVYDTASRRQGHVHQDGLVEAERPAALVAADPELAQLELGPGASPTVARANALLRTTTRGLFLALWLLAAWRAATFQEFLVWSAVVLLGSYWLLITEIWPWYATWALALAALAPARRPALLAALLSCTALTLYVSGGYEGTDLRWIHAVRSIPAFVLPLALFALVVLLSRVWARRGAARPAPPAGPRA